MLMKTTVALVACTVLQANACRAGAIEDALKQEIELQFVSAPLQDVVDFLKVRLRVEIELTAKDKKDAPITIREKSIRAKEAMKRILTPLKLEARIDEDAKKVLIVPGPCG